MTHLFTFCCRLEGKSENWRVLQHCTRRLYNNKSKMPPVELGGECKRSKLDDKIPVDGLHEEQSAVGKVKLRFAKLSENAYTPTKGSALAAGFDLYSAYDYIVPKQGKQLVMTDIQIALPDGCYGRVAPRSGLAAKHFIDVGAGVIDQDYRGNVGVVLFNFNQEEFKVKKGDRVAQLILERIFLPSIEEVQRLDETERGEGGFGSTG